MAPEVRGNLMLKFGRPCFVESNVLCIKGLLGVAKNCITAASPMASSFLHCSTSAYHNRHYASQSFAIITPIP